MTQFKFYTLPPSQPVLSRLTEFLLTQNQHDRFLLPEMQIILPTRRSVRKLKQLLLENAPNSTLLLPKIQAINDLTSPLDADIPPEMPASLRLGLLLKLLRSEKVQLDVYPSVELTQQLCVFMDQIQLAEADLSKLIRIIPDQYAHHWQLSLDFLTLLQRKWPMILNQYDYLEPSIHRRKVWDTTTINWYHTTPTHPIIAAGLTGIVPSVGRLLKCIASLPHGQVILPGFDLTLTPEEWQSIKPNHPQYAYKHFFERENINVTKVQPWPAVKSGPTDRDLTLKALMKNDLSQEKVNLTGLRFLELETTQSETECVALIIREKLQSANQTIAVVSPDPQFNKRLRMELQRWHIDIDDSAGIPLTQTALGELLLQTALIPDFEQDPTGTIAILKHPFITLGMTRSELLKRVRGLETRVLRAQKDPSDLSSSLKNRILNRCQKSHKDDLLSLVNSWKQAISPYISLQQKDEIPFKTILKSHLTLLEQISAKEMLWESDAGKALVPHFQNLMSHADHFGTITLKEYTQFIKLFLKSITLNEPFSHPRVMLLGSIEARLIEADLVIITDANEGSWPTTLMTNPWLNRSMQRAIGLPDPETQIGQEALDFTLTLGNQNVILTRALRKNGALTTPSRWLLRLKTLAACNHANITYPDSVQAWGQLLDQPIHDIKISEPTPCPPVSMRPLKLTISDIDLLLKDAYAFYAKNILKLAPLDQMEVVLSPTLFGIWLHRILENYPTSSALSQYTTEQNLHSIWAYQFETIKEWLLNQEEFDVLPDQLLTEKRFNHHRNILELIGKADRVLLKPEGVAIVDYKTGSLPTQQDLKTGLAPQLPLLAMFAKNSLNQPIQQLAYWDLKNLEIRTIEDPDAVIAFYEQTLNTLFENYLRDETVFKSTSILNHFQHLKRAQEWLNNNN